jgi:hypothetical protein
VAFPPFLILGKRACCSKKAAKFLVFGYQCNSLIFDEDLRGADRNQQLPHGLVKDFDSFSMPLARKDRNKELILERLVKGIYAEKSKLFPPQALRSPVCVRYLLKYS